MVGAQVHQHQEGVLPFAHVRISLNLLHLLFEFIESSVRGVVSVAVVFIFIVVVIVVVIVGSSDGDVADVPVFSPPNGLGEVADEFPSLPYPLPLPRPRPLPFLPLPLCLLQCP